MAIESKPETPTKAPEAVIIEKKDEGKTVEANPEVKAPKVAENKPANEKKEPKAEEKAVVEIPVKETPTESPSPAKAAGKRPSPEQKTLEHNHADKKASVDTEAAVAEDAIAQEASDDVVSPTPSDEIAAINANATILVSDFVANDDGKDAMKVDEAEQPSNDSAEDPAKTDASSTAAEPSNQG